MSGPLPPPQRQGARRQPRSRESLSPLPDHQALPGQCLSPPRWHPGREGGSPGGLPLAPMPAAWLVPPPGTSAPGSRLAPVLFQEDLTVPAGVSGTARVPALSAPTGSGKMTSIHPKRGPASVGCQRAGVLRAYPLSLFIPSAPLSGFVSPYSK